MNYKIYTVYHNDNLLQKYNLKIDKYHNLFATHKYNQKDNINYFHKYLNEYCAMYFVWKNNLYIDFVGFEHYRRRFNINKIPNLKENEIYVKQLVNKKYTLHEENNWLLDLIYYENNIKKLYGEKNKYIDFIYNSHKMIVDECFIMYYNKFKEMIKFVHNLILMFDKDINGNFDYNTYLNFYNNNDYLTRGHIIEQMISMWILCNYNISQIYSEN